MPSATAEVEPLEKKHREIRDRKTVTDAIAVYMHDNHPSWTIDQILGRPTDAMQMGIAVAAKLERISQAAAKRLSRALKELEEGPDAAALDEIDEVCRAAPSSRRRGDLKLDRY